MVNRPARGERGGSLQSLLLANTLETDLAGVESVWLTPRFGKVVNLAGS